MDIIPRLKPDMRKKLLVISPIPTHPRNAGHRERIYQFIRHIQATGCDVHVLYVTLEQGGDIPAMRKCWGERFHLFQFDIDRTPYRCSPSFHRTFIGQFIRKVGFRFGKDYTFPYAIDDWYDNGLEEYLANLQQQWQFDGVVMEYLFLSKGLCVIPDDVLKIIDTIDVFTNRHRQYQRHGEPPIWFSTTRRQERRALQRPDVIVAIQEHERQFFQELVPEKHVVCIGHLFEPNPLPFREASPLNLLFLASSNPVNVNGLHMFLDNIFPQIRTQYPDVQLLLAGTLCNALPNSSRYIKLGEFDDAKDIYLKADVVISPLQFGTGLKIKNVEAMGYAKPLVTTPVGTLGLEDGKDIAFRIGATPEEFARHVIELLTHSDVRRQMGQDAYQFAEKLQQLNLDSLLRTLQFRKKP